MEDLVLWSAVLGGIPFALALIECVAEWLRRLIHAGPAARGTAARERRPGDSAIFCSHC